MACKHMKLLIIYLILFLCLSCSSASLSIPVNKKSSGEAVVIKIEDKKDDDPVIVNSK